MPQNRILASLPQQEYQRLLSRLEPILLTQGTVLFQPGERARHVVFPGTAVLSVVVLADSGASVEAAMIGRDGIGCLEALLADGRTIHRILVRASGTADQVDAALLREEFRRPGPLQDHALRYAQRLITQLCQATLCNRVHSVSERLCRWLLMAQDTIGSPRVEATQEFVSQMLGVRRAGITEAAGALQDAGAIRMERGHMTILDRRLLEEGACGCYGIVASELTRLSGEPPHADGSSTTHRAASTIVEGLRKL